MPQIKNSYVIEEKYRNNHGMNTKSLRGFSKFLYKQNKYLSTITQVLSINAYYTKSTYNLRGKI